MLKRLTDRLTYANVTATLALFVALGGTSYAALNLPRNSVGSAQIRRGAVRSRQLHDHSIKLRDFGRRTRTALTGKPGPQGPAGRAGPAGAPAVSYFEAVASSGDLLRGDATGGGRGAGPGLYDVTFPTSVSGCAFVATIGTTDATIVGPGHAVVRDLGGKVGIQTYDAAGNAADLPFHLIVAC